MRLESEKSVHLESALAATPNLVRCLCVALCCGFGRAFVSSVSAFWSLCSPLPRLCVFCLRSCPPQSRPLYRAWLCLCPLFVWSPLPAVLLSALKLRRAFAPCLLFFPLVRFSVLYSLSGFCLHLPVSRLYIELGRAVSLCRINHLSLGLRWCMLHAL